MSKEQVCLKQKAWNSISFLFRYVAIIMWAYPKNCIALGTAYDPQFAVKASCCKVNLTGWNKAS
jgi:hypothetical protein